MIETHQRAAVSIVCVSNNPLVLNDCLIRSIDTHRPTAPKTELIVVENSLQEFSTAGAALNYGVSLAHNEVCVLVHQDVYLHSLVRLEEAAAALLTDTGIGLLGASGITADGDLRGRIRDRFVLLGRTTDGFAEVDSVDEVLFMARRDQLLRSPLSEDPDVAWHAYAVEYGARMRCTGRKVVAGRIPLTHNSLTTNLQGLTDAHTHVAMRYFDQVPITTTCGTIDGASAKQRKVLPKHRWRYQWLRGSRQAYVARRAVGQLPVVLSDIRFDVDSLLENCGGQKLTVIALESAKDEDADLAETVELQRHGRTIRFQVESREALKRWVSSRGQTESLLLTNVDSGLLSNLRFLLREADALLGFSQTTGFWLIVGPAAKASPAAWQVPSAKPFGLRATR